VGGRKQVTAEDKVVEARPAAPAAAGPAPGIRRGGALMTARALAKRKQEEATRQQALEQVGGVQGRSRALAKQRVTEAATAEQATDPDILAGQAIVDRRAAEDAELLSSTVLGGSTTLQTVPTGFNERVQALGTQQQIGSQTTTTQRPNVSPELLQQYAGAIDFEKRAMSAQLDAQAEGMGIRSNLSRFASRSARERVPFVARGAEDFRRCQ
jgi:hypothetical protein